VEKLTMADFAKLPFDLLDRPCLEEKPEQIGHLRLTGAKKPAA